MKTHLIKLPHNIYIISVHAWPTMHSCIYFNVYLNIYILGDFNLDLSLSLDHLHIVGGPKNTHIYACTLCVKARAGASNNVCAHSIDDP